MIFTVKKTVKKHANCVANRDGMGPVFGVALSWFSAIFRTSRAAESRRHGLFFAMCVAVTQIGTSAAILSRIAMVRAGF